MSTSQVRRTDELEVGVKALMSGAALALQPSLCLVTTVLGGLHSQPNLGGRPGLGD